MALNKSDEKILQEIVDTEGKCLSSVRCSQCPFRARCLPEFLNPQVPTESQRFQMALDVLTHHALIDDESIEDRPGEDFEWQKK